MSQQRSVSPFHGFEEVGLPTCSGPQMVAKSWPPLLQLSFGEWEKGKSGQRLREGSWPLEPDPGTVRGRSIQVLKLRGPEL
jgi:hypothetical protein